MQKIAPASITLLAAILFIAGSIISPPISIAATTTAPTTAPSTVLQSGWTLLKEGKGEGLIEQDAKNPANPSPHLLRIAATTVPDPGEGRIGATSAIQFPVQQDQWFDITFSAMAERASVGLVFSLENADGKVLARTTLPEIGGARGGRGGRGRGGAAAPGATPAAWTKYLVSLHVRAADPNAHVTITPIEPTNIWLDGLLLTPRSADNQ